MAAYFIFHDTTIAPAGPRLASAPSPAFMFEVEERFELKNDAPKPRKIRFDNNVHRRQVQLFSGLDCLAGQSDLFDEGPIQ